MRGRRLLLALPLALGLAACADDGDDPSADVVAGTTTAASTTSANATSASPPTTSAANGSTTTTASSSTTAAVDPASVDVVTRYFDQIGLPATPEEATCLASHVDDAVLASLADAADSGAEANETTQIAVFQAIVRCEPQSYADAQIEAIVSLGAPSEEAAACIVAANNELLRSDPELLALASGELAPSEWPDGPRNRLRDSLLGCVPPEVADKIIRGGD